MDNARELLQEASRVLELLPPEESDDLISRIALYLGEPIQIGDTLMQNAGVPQGDESWNGRDPVPEGLEITEHQSTYTNREGEETAFTYNSYRYPEAGEARYLEDFGDPIVVTINGIRYRVEVFLCGDNHYGNDGAKVTFTRTEEPETEFLEWDEQQALRNLRNQMLQEITTHKKTIKNAKSDWAGDAAMRDEVVRWAEKDIERAANRITAIDNGDVSLRAPFTVQVFGQPQFIQNEIFPVYQGRSAMHLMTINTNWGDAGNVNIMFACDENGVPARAWFEASCH